MSYKKAMRTKHFCGKGESREYETFNYAGSIPGDITDLTGSDPVGDNSKIYICGTYTHAVTLSTSFVYKGYISGDGVFYNLNFPNAMTYLEGVRSNGETHIQTVGYYLKLGSSIGCLYQGPLDGSGMWTSISFPSSVGSICHGVINNLVVGNYSSETMMSGAFIYNIKSKTYYDVVKPNTSSISVYGICGGECGIYTLCGQLTDASGKELGFIVDWNNRYHILYNWQTYSYDNDPVTTISTGFYGISIGCDTNYYSLVGNWASATGISGFFATIKRSKCSKHFKPKAKWENITYPGETATSSNTVSGNLVIGSYLSVNGPTTTVSGFVAQKTCA